MREKIISLGGTFHFNEDDEPGNALYLISPDGELSDNIYLKQHLVPFGEYVPMRSVVEFLIPPLADMGMLSDDHL